VPLWAALGCQLHGAPAREPVTDVRRYVVAMEGRISGAMTTSRVGPHERETHFAYRDRERGPNLRVALATSEDGLPVRVSVSGEDADGNAVAEDFVRSAGRAVWHSPVDEGQSDDRRAFYVPASPVPESLAALARALVNAGGTLPLLPAGEARLQPLGRIEVAAEPGRHQVNGYAVLGLQFGPSFVWLDEAGDFFASGSPYLAVVRKGYEASLPSLFKAQSAALMTYERTLARTLADRPERGVAITSARLVDVQQGVELPGMTVLVEGGWISRVGKDGTVAIPEGARRIDAAGRALLPGLWDMHVHPEDMGGLLHLAAGVTTVRDLGSNIGEAIGRRKAIDSGEVLGPRMLLGGLIDGPGSASAPTRVLVSDDAQARAAVDRYAALGYDQIKVYNSVPPLLVPVIAQRAHELHLRLSGHVPHGMTAEGAVLAGVDEVHHAYFLFPSLLSDLLRDHPDPLQVLLREAPWMDLSGGPASAMISLFRSRGVVVDPTLALCEQMYLARPGAPAMAISEVLSRFPPQVRRKFAAGGTAADAEGDRKLKAYFKAILHLVKALHDGKVRVVAGTDGIPAGFGLERELELLSEAGLTNAEVLRLATLGAAEVMGRERESGSVEAGKRADLMLVDGDPLARISDLRRASLVVRDGVLLEPSRLYQAIGIAPR